MRKTLALMSTIILLVTPQAAAEDADSTGVFHRIGTRVNRLLDLRDGRFRVDTLYLRRVPGGLRMRVSLKAHGTRLEAEGVNGDSRFRSDLETQVKYVVSVSAHYRGLSLALSLNPLRWSGKNKDFEVEVNAYGNRMGADIVYQSANTFGGVVTTDGGEETVAAGTVSQDLFIAGAYYTFNGRRFSYPAAFGVSWEQRKSCGSWMIGASLLARSIDVPTHGDFNLHAFYVALGGGYGYNAVVRGSWLLHVSALPQLVAYSRGSVESYGERRSVSTRFPDVIYVGRLGVTKHFGRYFAGMNAIVNASHIGGDDVVAIGNVKWQGRFFFGFSL